MWEEYCPRMADQYDYSGAEADNFKVGGKSYRHISPSTIIGSEIGANLSDRKAHGMNFESFEMTEFPKEIYTFRISGHHSFFNLVNDT